jgi:hypothetical protein
MKVFILLLASLCSFGSAFHVDKFFEPTQQYLHDIEKKFIRQTDTVEEYSDKDRLSWAAPPDTKVRHSNELASMQSGDRTWRNPPKNVVQQSDGKNQAYTAADRKWRFPDPSKVRHSTEARAMSPEDRKWTMPKTNQLLED